MEAFLEILTAVIRSGPKAKKYGDPFEFAAVVTFDGMNCKIKALSTIQGDKRLKLGHAKAAVKLLEDKGYNVDWDRYKTLPEE